MDIESFSSESDHRSSSSSLSASSDEDETSNLLDKIAQLRQKNGQLRSKLAEVSRNLVLANNVRIKHKERNKELEDEVTKLRKRNEALQNMLLTEHSAG